MNGTAWLEQLAPAPGWLFVLIAAISLAESLAIVGLVVPGVVLITAAASLAGHHELSIALILACGFIGAVAGDALSFVLGYTQRHRIPGLWPFTRHPQWLERGQHFFARYGMLSVLIGRFVGPVRPIIPLVAGMMRMPPSRFAWINVVSALLWAPAYLLPGYLLGNTWQQLPAESERWLTWLAAVVVTLLVIFSLLRQQLSREGRFYLATARFARRHPGCRRLWNALRSSGPEGEFPLASLSLFLVGLMTFIVWTLWVLTWDKPPFFDTQLRAYVLAISQRHLTQLAQWLAEAGDTLGVSVLVAPWLIWWLYRRHFPIVLHWLAALGGVAALNTLLKHLVGRVRPDVPDYLTGSFSYPSAHTSTAVVLYGLAAAFTAAALPYRHRLWPYWSAIVVCVLMALSRLMLGVHWLSDLVGGALLGVTLCALVRVSYHRYLTVPLRDTPWPWLLAASAVLLLVRILWLPAV